LQRLRPPLSDVGPPDRGRSGGDAGPAAPPGCRRPPRLGHRASGRLGGSALSQQEHSRPLVHPAGSGGAPPPAPPATLTGHGATRRSAERPVAGRARPAGPPPTAPRCAGPTCPPPPRL